MLPSPAIFVLISVYKNGPQRHKNRDRRTVSIARVLPKRYSFLSSRRGARRPNYDRFARHGLSKRLPSAESRRRCFRSHPAVLGVLDNPAPEDPLLRMLSGN